MKSKIILSAVLASLTVGGIWVGGSNLLNSNYDKFENSLLEEKNRAQGSSAFEPQGDNTVLDTSFVHEEMLEIELSAQDVRKADTTGIIGVSEPFNNEFITRVDVINSINRIGEGLIAFNDIDKSFQNEFLTLRHVEMVEGVREVNSSLKPALKEYAEKIKEKTQQEDVTKLNGNTLSSDSDLKYKVDVDIAETEALLNGR